MTARHLTRVCVEAGARRTFASALDWPGWSRSGRDEAQALETLAAYAERYAPVTEEAGIEFSAKSAARFEVVERAPGNATTDFGAPAIVAEAERAPLDAKEAERLGALLVGCWAVFERVAREAPAQLRKGPRGGGRDRDQVVEHVVASELAYARKVGIRLGTDISATRAGILGLLAGGATVDLGAEGGAGGRRAGPSYPAKWPLRYAVRRLAWHVLDHAWEIEDKS
jgi:hypothetical protein